MINSRLVAQDGVSGTTPEKWKCCFGRTTVIVCYQAQIRTASPLSTHQTRIRACDQESAAYFDCLACSARFFARILATIRFHSIRYRSSNSFGFNICCASVFRACAHAACSSSSLFWPSTFTLALRATLSSRLPGSASLPNAGSRFTL